MALRAQVEMLGLTVEFADTAKAYRYATRIFGQGLANAAVVWRDKYMPGHFETWATRKYGYEARTRKYEKRKRIKYGHNRPLVLTGQTLRMATQQLLDPKISNRAGKIGAEVRIRAPRHFFMFNKNDGRKFIDKRDELTRTVESERARLAQVAQDSVIDSMDRHPSHRIVKIL